MAGGVFTGANPSYVARELAYQLKDSGASIMLASSKSLEVALRAADMAGMDASSVFVFDDSIPGLNGAETVASAEPQHWTRLVASEERGQTFVWDEPRDSSATTCTLNYSSGTVCSYAFATGHSLIPSRQVSLKGLRLHIITTLPMAKPLFLSTSCIRSMSTAPAAELRYAFYPCIMHLVKDISSPVSLRRASPST